MSLSRLSHPPSRVPPQTLMHDSETESEPECDLKKWDATEFASQLPRAISGSSDRGLAERVTDAIATLESIPVEEVLTVSYQDLVPDVGSNWGLGCRMRSFIDRLKVQPMRYSCFWTSSPPRNYQWGWVKPSRLSL